MRATFAFVLLVTLLSGCIGLLDFPELPEPDDEFICQGACIGNGEFSLPDGRVHNGPMPEPTMGDGAPVVSNVAWTRISDTETGLDFTIQGSAASAVYMEYDGVVYVVDPLVVDGGSGSYSVDACNVLAQQQGYSCTTACVKACSCVDCDDATMEKNIVDSCAVNCSIYSHQGQIGPEPYTSEEVFADFIYNGNAEWGISGMLQSLPQCSGDVCSSRAAAQEEKRMRVSFYHPGSWTMRFPDALMVERVMDGTQSYGYTEVTFNP